MTPFDYIEKTNKMIFDSILSLGKNKPRKKKMVYDIIPPFNDEDDEFEEHDCHLSPEDGCDVCLERYLRELKKEEEISKKFK